jgi:serine/threonine protein phosphatase PrpC
VEAAFLAERLRPPTERYELPMASLMMVEALGERLTFSWFGDCTALLARPGSAVEVIGEALESRGQETRRAAQLAAELGIHPAGALSRPEFLADRRAARNRLNREGGPWVFAPDAACADHVLSVEVLAPAGSLVLLASDGLTALVADYQRYDPEGLVRAAETAGLQSLFDELRAVEAADPHGARYPRFKTSDDATGLVLRTTP